jgi:hypothetical protein
MLIERNGPTKARRMRKATIIFFFGFLIINVGLSAQEHTYVGAVKCKKCHKAPLRGNQYQAWLDSRHNKSYAVLSSLSALEEAKKENLTTPPNESHQCLKCHSSFHEKAPNLVVEGVTCEVCHGPGSDYAKMNIMKNKEKAFQNGLAVYASRDAIKEKCVTCHMGEQFNLAASWEKIKHPVPAKQ